MKKIILLGVLMASAAAPAFAIGRYNSMSMSCAEVQALISRERAVILRYPATRVKNMTLYDRYVSDGAVCNTGEYAARAYVQTKDNPSCPVYTCESTTDLDGTGLILPFR